jgi:hypothetical protein
MLIIKKYKTKHGFEQWEYKIFYKDINRETKCKRRRGFHTQEEALRSAEKMIGLMRFNRTERSKTVGS